MALNMHSFTERKRSLNECFCGEVQSTEVGKNRSLRSRFAPSEGNFHDKVSWGTTNPNRDLKVLNAHRTNVISVKAILAKTQFGGR